MANIFLANKSQRVKPSMGMRKSFSDFSQTFADNILKSMRTLTPRTYLGVGYSHVFRNNTDQSIVYVPATVGEYDSLAGVGGSANNPTLGGHTWLGSFGGSYKVNTANERLGANEYYDAGGSQLYVEMDSNAKGKQPFTVASSEVFENKIDEGKYLTL